MFDYSQGLRNGWLTINEVREMVMKYYVAAGDSLQDSVKQLREVTMLSHKEVFDAQNYQREKCWRCLHYSKQDGCKEMWVLGEMRMDFCSDWKKKEHANHYEPLPKKEEEVKPKRMLRPEELK
jgi:hypothetical protein